MYDTRFFIETWPLKGKIVAGRHGHRDAPRILERFNAQLRPAPLVFNIETTNYCNMRCRMCQRTTDLRKPIQHMSMATFQRIAEQITPPDPEELARWHAFVERELRGDHAPSENNFYFDIVAKAVTLHGFGEPLLDPHLVQRVALLSQRGIPTYFSCTPNNLRLPLMGELFAAGLTHLKCALDALDDETARWIRGPHADFTQAHRKILETIRLKEEMGAPTTIVLTMLNMGEEAQGRRFLELWEGLEVYAYVKSLDNQWLLRRREETEAAVENRSHYKRQYCEYPWTSVTILADGSVVPCTQDLNGEWTFGNVNQQSLAEIWHSERYRRFREMHVTGDFPPDFMCHARCDLELVADHYPAPPAHQLRGDAA